MNPNTNNYQLHQYQIYLNTGQIIVEPIENIQELRNIIHNYGRNIILSITFYFYDGEHPDHYLILRNTRQNNRFIPEFYHYYDEFYQRVELSRQEQRSDFRNVINYLNTRRTIANRFVPYVIDPFHLSSMT